MKKSVSLDGAWRLRYGKQAGDFPVTPEALAKSDWPEIEATVPGNVEVDLQRAGVIADDLAFGANIHALRQFESYDWWYSRVFEIEAGRAETAVLVFEGLDCFATV